MLENPTDSSSTASISTKRYAPPNQRNRSLGRRKSGGDRLERANSYVNDGDKNQRNVHILDHADPTRLIALQGCRNSEAYQLLNNRWAAAMNAYENPSTDLSQWPVMYSGSGASPWGQIRPHQSLWFHNFNNLGPLMMSPVTGVEFSGHQIDFMSKLRRAMHNSNPGSSM